MASLHGIALGGAGGGIVPVELGVAHVGAGAVAGLEVLEGREVELGDPRGPCQDGELGKVDKGLWRVLLGPGALALGLGLAGGALGRVLQLDGKIVVDGGVGVDGWIWDRVEGVNVDIPMGDEGSGLDGQSSRNGEADSGLHGQVLKARV